MQWTESLYSSDYSRLLERHGAQARMLICMPVCQGLEGSCSKQWCVSTRVHGWYLETCYAHYLCGRIFLSRSAICLPLFGPVAFCYTSGWRVKAKAHRVCVERAACQQLHKTTCAHIGSYSSSSHRAWAVPPGHKPGHVSASTNICHSHINLSATPVR